MKRIISVDFLNNLYVLNFKEKIEIGKIFGRGIFQIKEYVKSAF